MWLTIWLSGAVAAVIGNADMTAEFCEQQFKPGVIADIEAGVREDPDGSLWVEGSNGERFEFQPWEVTCEDVQLEIGYHKP